MTLSGTGSPVCLRPGAGGRIAVAAAALLFLPCAVTHAQFIRIGPFDFAATTKLEGIYTTNVDGVRPDSTDKEMKDYYASASFDLESTVNLFRNSVVDLSTGVTIERHARRKDLDTLSEPFGRARIDTAFDFGRYTLRLNLANETTTSTKEDTFVPSGESRQTRDVNTITDYGAELEWKRNDFVVIGGVNGSQERHQEEQFKSGDQDTYESYLNADWQFSQRLGLNYAYQRDKTDLINDPDTFSGWNEKHTVGLDFMILERPNFVYTLGAEQSSVQDEKIDWEPTHTFSLKDSLDLSRTLQFSGDAQYKYADKLASDEVALTCNLALDNEVSRTVRQSLSLNKEPANTFGSTTKTDVTAVDYKFTKQDLFVYNLTLTFAVGFSHNKPMDTPEDEPENIWTYDVSLLHERALSRKLQRTLEYTYHYEKSSLISENLVEHQVTLGFSYTF